MTGRPLPRVAALLFGSGMCALVYQVAWLRELRLVFGASTPASAAVLAVFMGGLGFGGLLLGKRADAAARPLAFYAKLEGGVAVTAALTPLLLAGARAAYVAVGGTALLGSAGGTVARLLLSALVLLPSTLLMGGTLPAAARAAARQDDVGRRSTALLYAANTLGAVTGAALTTFVLLEVFGTRLSLWVATLVNALVALAARAIDRGLPAPQVEPADAPVRAAAPRTFVLAAAAAVGFAFLVMELVWYRMLSPLLGGSTYTFGLILAVALAGIGAGSVAYGLRPVARAPQLAAFALSCAVEALLVMVPYALGDRVALLTVALRDVGVWGLAGHAVAWSVIAAVVVLGASLVAGYQFPLLIGLLGRAEHDLGRDVGLAYAFNTVGAIAGSLAGGFVLLPLLTAPGTWRACAMLLVGCALAALALDPAARKLRPLPLAAAAASLLAVALTFGAHGPTAAWRHSPIGAGRQDALLAGASPNEVTAWLQTQRRAVRWEIEGREASVALAVTHDSAFVVNGKSDGAAIGDAGTQIMGGLMGPLLHGQVRRALVVGLGTGSSAGWLGRVPEIERVDVVEIEPAIVEVARACRAVNHDVLANDKVRVVIGDAREVLLAGSDKYDVIFSEPSNPYRAGIASLYTHEFYQAVHRRLEAGGLLLQFIQAYEIDALTMRTVYATMGSVFANVESWRTGVNDVLLVASDADRPLDAARLRADIAREPFKSGLFAAWRVTDLEGVVAHYVARPSLARSIRELDGDSRLASDDRNLLEFGLARALGRASHFDVEEIRGVALARREARPLFLGAQPALDWERVDDVIAEIGIAQGAATPERVKVAGIGEAQARRQRAVEAWSLGRYEAALRLWSEQPRAPIAAIELLALAHAHAALGHTEALPLVEQLRAHAPTEALVLEAVLQHRRGEPALAPLATAIVALRDDPWPHALLVADLLVVASEMAARDPAVAAEVYTLLREPFAVDALRDRRERAALQAARASGNPARCINALGAFEAAVPWERAFLEARVDCYTRANHPLAASAQDDLATFADAEGTPFGAGLLP